MQKKQINRSNLAKIQQIKNCGVPLNKQYKLMNLDEMEPRIKQMIIDISNKYGDVRTILTLQELLTSSIVSRTKSIPRPQNAWILFRRNISKGLKMSVRKTSVIASYMWSEKSERENQFWNELSNITKEIHSTKYPNYKYRKSKICKKFSEAQNSDNDTLELKDITPVLKDNTSVLKDISLELKDREKSTSDSNNTNMDIDIINSTSELEVNMSEVDIDMVDEDYINKYFNGVSLYDQPLLDRTYYDSFIDNYYNYLYTNY
jgi:hypothetical protein